MLSVSLMGATNLPNTILTSMASINITALSTLSSRTISIKGSFVTASPLVPCQTVMTILPGFYIIDRLRVLEHLDLEQALKTIRAVLKGI